MLPVKGRSAGGRIWDFTIVAALALGLGVASTTFSSADDGTAPAGVVPATTADGGDGATAGDGAAADPADVTAGTSDLSSSPVPTDAAADGTPQATSEATATAEPSPDAEATASGEPTSGPGASAEAGSSPTPTASLGRTALGSAGVRGDASTDAKPTSEPTPTPTATAPLAANASIVVHAGKDRTASTTVSGLAGATFGAWAADDDETPAGAPVAACVTDASGVCTISVPARTSSGGNSGGYWVQQVTPAVAGYSILADLTVDTNTSYPYRYHTGSLAAGATIDEPAGTGYRTSSGLFADARVNPALMQVCGLNIAVLFDTSSSIDSTEMSQMKSAASDFVTALTGTPSSVALYSFASNAPGGLTTKPLRSILSSSDAAAVKNDIATLPSQGNGSTNWDRGLWQIAASGTHYDVVVMLTDGVPTYYGPGPSGDGSEARFVEIEHAIFSANAVKAQGTRIMAVGIGVGSNAYQNLAAISGPNAGSDYFLTNFSQLSSQLQAIAMATCGGTITVTKQVQKNNGTTVAGSNWTFATSTSGVTPASGATDADGALTFDADLSGTTSKDVTITETQQAGYTLVQQSGKNAVCTVAGSPVSVTNVGSTGFTVTAQANKAVACTVINKEPLPVASVLVNKQWVIDGQSYANGSQPAGFSATLGLTKQASPAFGTTYTNYLAGEQVTIAETPTVPANCAVQSSGDLGAKTLAAGLNTYTVTNTVTCTKLSLVKSVVNDAGGSAVPANFTLTATPNSIPGQAVISGAGTVNGAAAKPGTYTLSESTVAGYAPVGGWTCQIDGGAPKTVTNNQITLAAGEKVTCSITNGDVAPSLKLTKTVAPAQGLAAPSDWTLSAAKAGSPTIQGAGGTAGFVAAQAGSYSLSESASVAWLNSAYQAGTWACYRNGEQQPFSTGASVTLALGDQVECRITNTYVPGRLTLVKHVDNGTSGGSAPASSWTLKATPDDAAFPTLSGAGSELGTTYDAVGGQQYTLSESGSVPGYTNGTQWVCTGAVTQNGNKVQLAAGASATCTITNTAQQPTLTLVKIVGNGTSGSTKTPADFTLTALGASKTVTGQGGSVQVTQIAVPVGTYQLSESGPAGFTQSKWICRPANAGQPAVGDFAGASATSVSVALGDATTCFVYNEAIAPTLKLIKHVAPDGSADPTTWQVTASAAGQATIGGAGGTDGVFVAAKAGVTYQLAESGGNADFINGAFTCSGTQGFDSATGQLTLALGEQVTCEITNSAPKATLDIAKSVDAGYPAQRADGTWDIHYTLTVTNLSPYRAATYSLSDALHFGSGITVNSASASGPDGAIAGWNGAGSSTLASGKTLAPSGSAVYHLVVNATVPQGAFEDGSHTQVACLPEGNSGFANEASATSGDDTYHVRACAEPAAPTFDKSDAVASQNANGTWTLTYTLTVTNAAPVQVSYDLADTPGPLPTGVSIVGTPTVESADVMLPNPQTWTGSGTIISGVLLPGASGGQNSVHTYTVSLVVAVEPDAAPDDLTCTPGEQGGGVLNSASVTSGEDTYTDTGCGQIETPTVSIAKHVTSTTQNPDGSWTVAYDVTATNDSSLLAATYDLSDTPQFGTGITITAASATGPGGAGDLSSSWNATTPALAAHKVIVPGGSHVYHITISATVAAGAYDSDNAQVTCERTDEGPQGGFLNGAEVTASGTTTTVWACDQPAQPTFVKHAVGSPTKTGANTWEVAYDLVVTNPSDTTLYYSLADHPILPPGATFTGVATSSDIAVNPAWTGIPPNTGLVSGQGLGGGATHTVHVTLTVQLAPMTFSQFLFCPADQGTLGATNVGTITAGADSWDSSACVSLPPTAWTLTKTSTPPSGEVEPGDSITYTLTVHNTTAVTAYDVVVNDDLANVLDDADLTSATFTPSAGLAGLGGDGHTLTWNVGALAGAASATLSYTVQVHADAWDTQLENLATGTGEVPPAQCTVFQPCSVEHTTPPQPTLQLVKHVVNEWGGEATPADFTLTATPGDDVSDLQAASPSGDGGVGPVGVYPGTYTLSESGDLLGGYTASAWMCSTTGPNGELTALEGDQLTVAVGDSVYCEITNSDKPAVLTLEKQVEGPYAVATPSDWIVSATRAADGTLHSGPGSLADLGAVLNKQVKAGTYQLGEAPALGFEPIGYTNGLWECFAASDEGHTTNLATESGQVMLANGEAVHCLVVNTAENPEWTITKSATTDSALTSPQVEPGDTITYTVTAQHLAGVPVLGVDITDDLSGVLGAGAYNDDAAVTAGSVSRVGDTLQWHLDALLGTQTLTYTVTVNPATWDQQLTNFVVGSGSLPPNQCAAAEEPPARLAADDGTAAAAPPEGLEPGCITTHEVPALPRLALVKQLNVQHGLSGVPEDWTLSATPQDGVGAPPGGESLEGAGGFAAVPVLPGTYQLAEQARDGDATFDPSQWIAGLWSCSINEGDPVTVEAGQVTLGYGDVAVCTVVNSDVAVDLALTKTATGLNADGTTESGHSFDYTLHLENVGDTAATGTHATDQVPASLKVVQPLPTVAGWSVTLTGTDTNGFGGVLTFTQDAGDTFDPGATAEVTFSVEVGDNLTADLDNTACVASNEADENPDNNCDNVTTPTKRFQFADLAARCERDTAWVYFDFTALNVENAASLPVTVTWRDPQGNVIRVDTLPAGTTSGRLLWPGVTLNANGDPIGYPGYRPLTAADDPNDPNVFEDLILDPSLPSYNWRSDLTVTFEINPSATVTVTYPPASAACVIPRIPGVQIAKTASAPSVQPGGAINYTLSVWNADLGAAYPVRLVDQIPAYLRVTSVTTDSTAFPAWQNCAVTGQGPTGYGGTLNCELNGRLGYGVHAPDVVVRAVASPNTPAGTLTNTGQVCWIDPANTSAGEFCNASAVGVSVTRGTMEVTGAAAIAGVLVAVVLSGAGLVLLSLRRRRRLA